MLDYAALFVALCLFISLVRGDVDRRPGPIRTILLSGYTYAEQAPADEIVP